MSIRVILMMLNVHMINVFLDSRKGVIIIADGNPVFVSCRCEVCQVFMGLDCSVHVRVATCVYIDNTSQSLAPL